MCAVTGALFGGRITQAVVVSLVFCACLEWSYAVTHETLGSAATATGAFVGLLVSLSLATAIPLGVGRLTLTATAVCVAVTFLERVLHSQALGRSRVLLVGSEGSLGRLADELSLRRRYFVVGTLDERLPDEVLAETIQIRLPDIVVRPPSGLLELYDRALGRTPPREASADWLSVELKRAETRLERMATRSFDILLALLGLVLTAPIWPVLALLAARRTGGVFFRQLRVGKDGRVFGMYKFRTMSVDAEPEGLALWAQAADPRITLRGRILRETHLDELPQLWNVLRGDMSIVGPRPERPELEPMLEDAIPHWRRRQLVKPGITGWAQVCQGYADNCDASEQKLSYDLWYVRHRNLLLDLAICMRTVPTLALRSGAR